jgi:hypothetical protein
MSTDATPPGSIATEAAPLPASVQTASRATVTVEESGDPGLIMTSCANCGAQMIDRKCKLICSCGYFLSCSDYY